MQEWRSNSAPTKHPSDQPINVTVIPPKSNISPLNLFKEIYFSSLMLLWVLENQDLDIYRYFPELAAYRSLFHCCKFLQCLF